jgi:hypothetical protein
LNPVPGHYNNFQTWQLGLTFQMPLGFRGPLANARQAQYALLRQRAFLQQVVHQTTHALARFFIEVDANYKQFKTAGRLKNAALQRLNAQKAFYENGTITIDRYLDAVNRWANAVAQEADFKSRYNTSIAALEEAKGTLLAYDNIALAEGPWPAKAYVQARDQQAAHTQHPVGGNGNYHPLHGGGNINPDPVAPLPPPDLGPPNPRPAMPAPAGPLGPPPTPAPPFVPAGEPNILGQAVPRPNGDAPDENATRGEAPASPAPVADANLAEPGVLPASLSLPALPPDPADEASAADDSLPALPGEN